MKKYVELEEKLKYGNYYSLLKFCDMIDQDVINDFDGYGELVYVNDRGDLLVDEDSNAINDICDNSSPAYKDEEGLYLVGVVWYNN